MNWIKQLFSRRRLYGDLSAEIEEHLAEKVDELVAGGMSREEATFAARREFGNVLQIEERSREVWQWPSLENFFMDVRYGLRQVRRNPGFAVVVVLILALGMGANAAIFTLVDAIMLKSLPVANPNQLWRLGNANQCCGLNGFPASNSWAIYSYRLYVQLRDHTPEFSEMTAFSAGLPTLSVRRRGAPGPAEAYVGEFVSGNYFTTFGIGAFAGRTLLPADDLPGAPPVVVISHRAWRERFGSDPSMIGSTLILNTIPYVVSGIAPPGFFGETLRSDPPDFWLPLATEPALDGQNSFLNQADENWLYIIGRLKPGVQARQLPPRLTLELRDWLSADGNAPAPYRGEIAKQLIELAPAGGGVALVRSNYWVSLRLLMTVAGLVLLIACANIANLMLARGEANRAETALRVALGAPRSRLIRKTLTESVLLALFGGTAGLCVAYAGTHAILLVAFRGAHYIPIDPRPSVSVFGFALLLSLATGIVFGVGPAWITSRSDPADALRGGRSTGRLASFPRQFLVVLQLALSVVLLTGTGLLTRSVRNLQNQKFGFQTEGRLMVKFDPLLSGYSPDRLYGLYQQLERRLPEIPGVMSASFSLYSPMESNDWGSGIHTEGHPPDEHAGASWLRISPHYFDTLGTRLLRGRTIDDEDTPTSRRVAVISKSFAQKFFPKEDPMGKHFGIGGASHSGDFEIVGIVEDAKYLNAREPARATYFLPFLQTVRYNRPTADSAMLRSNYAGDIELRVGGNPDNLEPAVRRTLADIDPNLTVLGIRSFGEQLALNFNQDRLIARLTELFGLLALILACVGIYGATAYKVAGRTSEFGIRIALGASRKNVLALVLRGALMQVGLGLAIGIPLALVCGRLLAAELYGIKSHDPMILSMAATILAACAVVAGFVPARRATKVDPMVALRYE